LIAGLMLLFVVFGYIFRTICITSLFLVSYLVVLIKLAAIVLTIVMNLMQ
jgi:hypothetical protein